MYVDLFPLNKLFIQKKSWVLPNVLHTSLPTKRSSLKWDKCRRLVALPLGVVYNTEKPAVSDLSLGFAHVYINIQVWMSFLVDDSFSFNGNHSDRKNDVRLKKLVSVLLYIFNIGTTSCSSFFTVRVRNLDLWQACKDQCFFVSLIVATSTSCVHFSYL